MKAFYLSLLFACISIFSQGCVFEKSHNTTYEKLSWVDPNSGNTINYERSSGSSSGSSKDQAPKSSLGPSIIEFENGKVKISSGTISSAGAFMSALSIKKDLFKWPIIIGGILLALGIVGAIALPPLLKKLGIGVGIAGLALMAASIVFAQYTWILAILGVLVLIGAFGYWLYKTRVLMKANIENVNSIEHLKEVYLTEEDKKLAFDINTASVPSRQSKTTKKLVNKIRDKQCFTENKEIKK